MLREVLWKDMLNMKINKNFIEIELGKLYAIWLREFKVFLREKSRIVASTFTPLLWLFVLGAGFGSIATNPSAISGTGHIASGGGVGPGIDYQKFIFPGIVSMSIIFSSVFFGSYIIWDRKFDFLKSVMVAPVSRTTIFIGKTFGGMTTSLMQARYTISSRTIPWNPLHSIFHSAYCCYYFISFICTNIARSCYWKLHGKFRRFSINSKLCSISSLLSKRSAVSTK